jgi:putative ABC transport system substrate-binding protein
VTTRRAFLCGLTLRALSAPLPVRAQPTGKTWRIGWLGDGNRAAREANTLTPLREGLRELGYIEGKNILIDARWSDGDRERLMRDAADFVRVGVDVIVAHGSVGARAAVKATTTVPIVVATSSDFIAAGLVKSLAHPGGNLTGTNDQAAETLLKQLDFLAELVPRMQRVAILWYSVNPLMARLAETVRTVAHQRNLAFTPIRVSRPDELERVIETAVRERPQAVIVTQDSWTLSNRARIVAAVHAKGIPVVASSRLFAESGALVSYGPDLVAVYKRAAVFVDKILKGTNPGDIPVEQPTKFEMVINVKMAKALGLTIPQTLLLRADQVIE